MKKNHTIYQTRTYYLTRLARSLYDSAVHEEDKNRLELHRHIAVSTAGLFNETINEDNLLHPDIGLVLILFIELKVDGGPEAEADRKDALRIIEELEKETKTEPPPGIGVKQDTLRVRAYYVTKLARALYDSAVHEEAKDRLELHRRVAVETARLFNEASEEDNILHPDLGSKLLRFIELKASGEPKAEAERKDALNIIEQLEEKIESWRIIEPRASEK